MRPIRFSCVADLPHPPERIAGHVLDVDRWPDFRGYGPVPGVRSAAFEVRTPEVVGSRIRVVNRDGSAHVEEVVEWRPAERLVLRMTDFSAPLSRLAAEFVETWAFRAAGGTTQVVRTFELRPRSRATWLPLRLIALFLRRAVARHLSQLQAGLDGPSSSGSTTGPG